MPDVQPSPSRCLISIANLFWEILYIKNANPQEVLFSNTDDLKTVLNDMQFTPFSKFSQDSLMLQSDMAFDVSLLYCLISKICNIPPHSNGWGLPPDTKDRSLAACIERIRIYASFLIGQSIFGNSKEADFQIILKNIGDDMDAIKMQCIETQWSSQKPKEIALHDPILPMDRVYDREGKLPKVVTNYQMRHFFSFEKN